MTTEIYGACVSTSDEEKNEWYNGLNGLTPGVDGISKADLERADAIFTVLGTEAFGGAQ